MQLSHGQGIRACAGPLITMWLYASVACASSPEPQLHLRETWSGFFAGTNVVWHVDVSGAESNAAQVGWTLRMEDAVIARGEVDLPPGSPAQVEIPAVLPQIRPGVVISASLTVELIDRGAGKTVARVEQPLWLFPKNPFADKQERLSGLPLHIFDPLGDTALLLEGMGLTLVRHHNPDALTEIVDGLLVVGEGVSFLDHRGLPGLLLDAAARGLPVLCLAPLEGKFPILGNGDSGDFPALEVRFRRSEVITELDKRLDANTWPPDGRNIGSGMVRGDAGMEVVEGQGWPWMEVWASKPNGRLVVCGFAVIEKWDTGPTPRFLLASIIEYLAEPLISTD